jgi:2-dehydro-3-deoxyphosphogluconate aldolase/(4S)-4-hydroxy-2-oxoglutarate aldolase
MGLGRGYGVAVHEVLIRTDQRAEHYTTPAVVRQMPMAQEPRSLAPPQVRLGNLRIECFCDTLMVHAVAVGRGHFLHFPEHSTMTTIAVTGSAQGRQEIVKRIVQAGLVSIFRADSPAGVVDAAKALVQGGVNVFEVTMTTPNALEAIAMARKALGDSALVGVGSVIDAETARRAGEAGAQFVVSPVFKPEVIAASHQAGMPAMPGCLTPTEILTATQAGADVVKVFPADHFGPSFFKNVLAPLPHLKLMPTGGVKLDNVGEWFAAGAVALGVGSALVKKEFLKNQDWAGLTQLARQFAAAVVKARA